MDQNIEEILENIASKEITKIHYDLSGQFQETEIFLKNSSVYVKNYSNNNIEVYFKTNNDSEYHKILDCESVMIEKSDFSDKRIQKNSKYSLLINNDNFGIIKSASDKDFQTINDFGKLLGEEKVIIETYLLKKNSPKIHINGTSSMGQNFSYEVKSNSYHYIKNINNADNKIKASSVGFSIIKENTMTTCKMFISKILGGKEREYDVRNITIIHE